MNGFRRALLPLALLLALAITAPRAWHFVSTLPEAEFDGARPFGFERASLPSLPFDTQEFRAEVRLLRWGSDRGHRHGAFHLIDSQSRVRLRGAFERGLRVGEWVGFDAESNVVLRGHYLADRRDGPWLVPLGSRTAEVEYVKGQLRRWRLAIGTGMTPWAEAPRGFEGELSVRAVGKRGGRARAIPGNFIAIGLGQFHTRPGSLDPEWVEEGTWVCLDVSGRLEGFGPMRLGRAVGQWTFFGAKGTIERQAYFDRTGNLKSERRTPPWSEISESFLPFDSSWAAPAPVPEGRDADG